MSRVFIVIDKEKTEMENPFSLQGYSPNSYIEYNGEKYVVTRTILKLEKTGNQVFDITDVYLEKL